MIFSRDEDGYDMSSIKLNYETQVFFNLGYVLELHICTLRAVVEGPNTTKNTNPLWTKSGRC